METLSNLLDAQTILVFVVALFAVWLYRSTRLPSSFPPGPRPMPIVGNLFDMGTDPAQAVNVLTKMKEKYGPVVGLKLGSLSAVILGSAEAVKEAFVDKAEDFGDRPHSMYALTKIWKKENFLGGVLWTNGDLWRKSRRFSLSSMRDFGVGKRSVEEQMYDEANAMCDVVAAAGGKPYDMHTLAQQATSNIISTVCFGGRFEYTDPEFLQMMEAMNHIVSSPLQNSAQNYIPALRFLPMKGMTDELVPRSNELFSFIEKQIDQHRPTFDPENPRDFVDLYLLKESEGNKDETFSKDNMLSIIRDLFLAGTETSSTSIRWLLLYMIHYPEIQRRCREELDHVVGSGRHPTLADRPQLPYIEATIQEMMRLGSVAALGAPHATTRDTTLGGYRIPRGTVVLSNIYAINTDPRHWSDPLTYNPDRWFGSDGQFRKRESYMPFSAGPRLCLGDSLARNEIFVFFCFLLQRFTFSCVDPTNPPSLHGVWGATLAPVRYDIIPKAR